MPWSLLDYDPERGGYVVPFTKEQLKAAPAYDIDELTRDDGYGARDTSFKYYNVDPYWQYRRISRRSGLAKPGRFVASAHGAHSSRPRHQRIGRLDSAGSAVTGRLPVANPATQCAALDIRPRQTKLRANLTSGAMTDFPIFDLSRFEQAGAAGRAALGAEVDEICRTTGFLAIIGHSVPEETIATAWNAARAFFDLAARGEERSASALCRLSLWLSRPRRRGAGQIERRRHAARPQGELQRRPAFGAARLERSRSARLLLRRDDLAAGAGGLRRGVEGLLRRDGGSCRAHHAGLCRRAEAAGGLFRRRHRPAGQRVAGAELSAPDRAAAARPAARRRPHRLWQPDHPAARSEVRRPADLHAGAGMAAGAAGARRLHHQHRRPDGAVDQRPLGVDAAPRRQPGARREGLDAAAVLRLLPPAELGSRNRLPRILPGARRSAALRAGAVRPVSDVASSNRR